MLGDRNFEKLELEYWDYTNLIKVTSIQQYF